MTAHQKLPGSDRLCKRRSTKIGAVLPFTNIIKNGKTLCLISSLVTLYRCFHDRHWWTWNVFCLHSAVSHHLNSKESRRHRTISEWRLKLLFSKDLSNRC